MGATIIQENHEELKERSIFFLSPGQSYTFKKANIDSKSIMRSSSIFKPESCLNRFPHVSKLEV